MRPNLRSFSIQAALAAALAACPIGGVGPAEDERGTTDAGVSEVADASDGGSAVVPSADGGAHDAGAGGSPDALGSADAGDSGGAVVPGGDGGARDAGFAADADGGERDAGFAADADGGGSAGLDGGGSLELGATPPMGWNSWNTFGCDKLNETLIKQIADVFVSSGMQAVGYQYVNLDDCWMDGRDSSGKLRWNTTRFPSGIPALADYIHGKGLKIGIYETPNTKTCAGLYGNAAGAVGSLGHETTDAQTFASWGIDYLKYDLCAGQRSGFAVMRDALRATGRPIFYSINPGNQENDLCPPSRCSLNLPSIANMWRIGFDIGPWWSAVIRLLDQNANLHSHAGPGHWNDPDMMEVGNGLNDTEGRAHFSLWAIMAAPLIAGNDLRSMSATTKAILTNSEVIAVDQDPLGIQGQVVASPGPDLQVWSKKLSGTNTRAVVLFNRGGSAAWITVQWSSIGIPAGAATVRDLWSHADLGTFNNSYTASSVPSHGVAMLKITSTATAETGR